MNIKQENARPSSGIKILNDDRIPALPLPVMTSVPLAPSKQISMSIAKAKTSPTKQKQMDHYVLQTTKVGDGEEDAESETIDFILTENDGAQENDGLGGPSGEITEELHLSGDEEEGDEKTEEIVEHVCGKCYKSFRRIGGLKKHLDFCRFDSGYHLRKAEMLKNLEKIERDAISMENKDVCFCCGESYDTFHLGHINCPDCPKSFKTQISYERHIFITHSEFDDHPCTICNAKLRSANLLKLHEGQHQNRGKPYACKICGKDFTRSYHLKRHQKYSSCSANENDSMNCKVCNKVYFRLDNLRAHLKNHLGTNVTKKSEYMCPICKNCFYSLSTLNIHTRTHTGERPFECDLCDKKFPSLVALKKHRRYHTGEKPYTCSVCNQSFAVKEVLNRHMKRHTGEKPHVCKECGKSFIQATQLRSHSKTHLKPYECNTCKEKFKTEKQLERHSKIHNKGLKRKNIQDFNCKVCSVAFGKKEQLVKHLKSDSHSKQQERYNKNALTYCSMCEKDFETVKSLQFHILKVHQVDVEECIDNNKDDVYKVEELNNSSGQIQFITTTSDGDMILNESNKLESETQATNTINNGLVVQEYIVNNNTNDNKQTIILQNEAYTIIPLDSDGIIETVTTNTMPMQVDKDMRKEQRKSLAQSLAAAIADDDGDDDEYSKVMDIETEDDIKLKENVRKLLDMLVDNVTLTKFGWPKTSEENVLCKVIENCGHNLSNDSDLYKYCDYATRMREYVKLLFTVVIHNDSIKELLNNYPIDEVIEYVLGSDDDDDDGDDDDDDIDDKELVEKKEETSESLDNDGNINNVEIDT